MSKYTTIFKILIKKVFNIDEFCARLQKNNILKLQEKNINNIT